MFKIQSQALRLQRERNMPFVHRPSQFKEFKADSMVHKCINCVTFNKHNPNKNVGIDHSSLDKKFPSMPAIIEKYRLNTEY